MNMKEWKKLFRENTIVEDRENPLKKYKNYDRRIGGIDIDWNDNKMAASGDLYFQLLPSAKIKEGDFYLDKTMGAIYWWDPDDWSLDLNNKKQYIKVKSMK